MTGARIDLKLTISPVELEDPMDDKPLPEPLRFGHTSYVTTPALEYVESEIELAFDRLYKHIKQHWHSGYGDKFEREWNK